VALFFSAGNQTNRYYGPVDRPFVRIGRGILYTAIFTTVKSACVMSATDQEIQKAIREGINTIRLHDREVRSRRLRQEQRHLEEEGSQNSDASQSEFIEAARQDSEDGQEDD